MLLFISFSLARAGDAFLWFLGEELHIDIGCKNHSGFISCFVLRFIRLDNPIFILKDFDLSLGCQTAYIEPRFDELARKKAITLKCTLKNASFIGVEGKTSTRGRSQPKTDQPRAGAYGEKNKNDLPILFQNDLNPLLGKLKNIIYDTIHTTLSIYNNRVRFLSYEAYSKELKLHASGTITEAGDLSGQIKIFFSPEIIQHFPNELKAILTQRSNGWASYYMYVERKHDKSSLKLESDKFRLNFERIESRKFR